ncbi:MAG: hypothetical protein ACKO96_04975 [Flammeovirgaceae bacterium]
MTIEFINKWRELKALEVAAQAERKQIELEIIKSNGEAINSQLDSDYGSGTAKIAGEKEILILTYPKKITWDNEKLAAIWDAIIASGQDANEYIDRKLSVSETRYKNMPSIYKGEFEQARTVEVGNPTFSIKEIK